MLTIPAWLQPAIITIPLSPILAITDENGYCNVQLGGGKYKVKAIIMHGLIGYANESMFELVEGQTREVIIVIREELRFLKLSPILESFLQEAVSAVCGFMYLYLFSIILIMTRYCAELLSA
jgi:hypothetical protein